VLQPNQYLFDVSKDEWDAKENAGKHCTYSVACQKEQGNVKQ